MQNEMQSFQERLLAVGLSDKEVAVYMALLVLGKGTVTEITRKAGINRTTGYDILDGLLTKKLISVSGKEPKQEYAAESPDHIFDYLQARQNELNTQVENAKNFVPQLKTLHNVKNRPRVRFYEGVDGLKEVYEDTLTSHEDLRSLALVDEAEQTLEKYFPKYYQRRAGKNIGIRAIFPNSPGARHLKKKDYMERRESLIIPNNNFDLKPEINVYDDKVMIASWSEKLGIIIESQEIANALKQLFELAWVEAKRLDSHMQKNSPE